MLIWLAIAMRNSNAYMGVEGKRREGERLKGSYL